MTQQLYTWEYQGQDEVGFIMTGGRLCSQNASTLHFSYFWQKEVTKLRPAKVVDADAVVIEKDVIHFDKFLNEVIEVSGSNYDFNYTKSQKVHECAMYLQAKIYPTPPVTKTYLATEQFIKVFKSLSDEKSRELGKADFAAWNAAWREAWNEARNAAWNEAWNEAWREAWNAADFAADFTTWNAVRDANLAILAKDAITKEHFNILMQPWTSCGLSFYAEDWEAVLNPKVTEPKNFGAVVEAKLDGKRGIGSFPVAERKHLWKLESSGWELINGGEFGALWCWFIDPVVISEGQK